MRVSKTEQHLYNTMKKILKNHFYGLQSVECYSDYHVGQTAYLIRFYERISVHGKRDLSLFDVLVKDSKNIEFDIVSVKITESGANDLFIYSKGTGDKEEGVTAEHKHSVAPDEDLNVVLSEFMWTVSRQETKSRPCEFVDLRAFFKSFFVVKNVVKVNDTINERIMLEVLNHHV